MKYLNKYGTKWMPSEGAEKVIPINRFKRGVAVANHNKPLKVKFYEQMGNYAIANFCDGSYSTDYELVEQASLFKY